jgi:hypothetical protein
LAKQATMLTDAISPVHGASGTLMMTTEFQNQLDEKRIAMIVTFLEGKFNEN